MPDLPKSAEIPTPKPGRKRWLRVLAILAIVCAMAGAVFYHYIVNGGMSARQTPSGLEAFVGQSLLNLSIPAEASALKNPLDSSAGGSDANAGRALYQRNCEACHGYDGSGKTSAGQGLYPQPPNLHPSAVVKRKRTDGELFYLIRNGVRNTGMPGWQLPDRETWQLVSYLRNLPQTVAVDAGKTIAERPAIPANATYSGSAACKSCHGAIYESWRKTPMANVVRDPHDHPDIIIPDLSKKDPLLTFTVADIALVYGSKWKQRYFKKVDDDYYVFPAQWDVVNKKWRPYFVKDDWWAPLYPPDNFKRPTSALCDGCHSVNFDIKTKTVTEWNVGCEKCHGAGSEHVKHPTALNIVNTARQGYVEASDVCIQCHSQGRTLESQFAGKYYDWPVGYDVTRKLSDYWKLEEHKLGETSFTHFSEGTAHKNRMQGNDYVTSQMYTHGVTCSTCHDVHGTPFAGNIRKPADVLCLDCHAPNSPNGPRAVSIEQHTHHPVDSAGSQCVACHMPKIAQTIADVYVRSHTFRFVSPSETDAMKIPNACNLCHKEKTTAWATAALKSWDERSPWRMAR